MTIFKAILFDLDGTLVDTAPDLANALNYVLRAQGKDPLPYSTIRPYASDGALGLLKLGFGIDKNHAQYEAYREKFLNYYFEHICEFSCLFNGIENIIDKLEAKNILWGIVTNKPAKFTEKLLKELKLSHRTDCVISGDTLPVSKPHPAPLLYAAKLLNLSASDCCYVGDAERDIQAAKGAKMYAIAALYGYIHPNARPELWKADAYITSPKQLAAIY